MGNRILIPENEVNQIIQQSKKLSKEEFIEIAQVLKSNNVIIKNYISEGSFGIVYEADLIKDGNDNDVEKVAVKVIKFKDENQKNSIVNEVKIQRKLNKYPYFIQIKKVLLQGNLVAIIMEFAQNSLIDIMKQNLDIQIKLEIMYMLLNGLSILKKEKIFHQDIKPENILLTNKNKVKLSDFGMSKLLDSNRSYTSNCEGGTYKYISPESLSEDVKNRKVGNKSDIYSLGIVFLELLGFKITIDSASDYRRGIFKIQKESYFKDQLEYKIYNIIITHMINPSYDKRGEVDQIITYFNFITQGLFFYISPQIIFPQQSIILGGSLSSKKIFFNQFIDKNKVNYCPGYPIGHFKQCKKIKYNQNEIKVDLCLSYNTSSQQEFDSTLINNSNSIVLVYGEDHHTSLESALSKYLNTDFLQKSNKQLLQILYLKQSENDNKSLKRVEDICQKYNLHLTKTRVNKDELNQTFLRISILSCLHSQFGTLQNKNLNLENYYKKINMQDLQLM